MRSRIIRSLPAIAVAAAVISLVIQTVLVIVHWDTPQGSDPGVYIYLAERCAASGQYYPCAADLNSQYLFNPGWVNFLVLCINVYGTWKAALVFNLLMSAAIIGFIWFLGDRFFSRTTACIAVVLWSALYSNWFASAAAGSEIPFLFLSLAGVWICLKYPEWYGYALAGVLFILANWVRPLVVIFLLFIVLHMILTRTRWINYMALFVPMAVGVLLIGNISLRNTGIFAPQATTSGINLIMTANDKAYGGVASHLIGDSTSSCYIVGVDSLNFAQRDSIYKSRAIEWIKDNPGRYAMLFVKKIGGVMVEDSWADRPLLGGDGFISQSAVGGGVDRQAFIDRCIHMFLGSLVYYVVILLFIIAVIKYFKPIIRDRSGKLLLLLLLVAGVGATCLFCVSPRYHYPMTSVLVLFAAMYLDNLLIVKR